MLDVRVRPRARADLEDAARWYEAQRMDLGDEFLDEIQIAFRKIAEHPNLYPELHRKTRRALLQRFPFGIFYRIEDGHVIVVAVMHSSRDPKQWIRRE